MRVRVCSFALFLVLAFSVAASAQVSFGVKGGLNSSTTSMDVASLDLGAAGGRLSTYTIGGFVVVPVNGPFSMQIEGLYSRKGMKVTGTVLGADFTDTLNVNYFTIPVLARFTPVKTPGATPYIIAGPEFALKVNASQTVVSGGQSQTDTSFGNNVSSNDVGLAFGAGVEVGRFLVEGRYTVGLKNLSTDPTEAAIKARVFTIMGGIRF